jgi:hypothetical protein
MPPDHATSTCSKSECDFACTLPYIECGGACTDTKTDRDNCGNCGKVCPNVDHGTTLCAASKCAAQCDAGYSQCNRKCVDTNSDKGNCGECGKKCGAKKTCNAGKCE